MDTWQNRKLCLSGTSNLHAFMVCELYSPKGDGIAQMCVPTPEKSNGWLNMEMNMDIRG